MCHQAHRSATVCRQTHRSETMCPHGTTTARHVTNLSYNFFWEPQNIVLHTPQPKRLFKFVLSIIARQNTDPPYVRSWHAQNAPYLRHIQMKFELCVINYPPAAYKQTVWMILARPGCLLREPQQKKIFKFYVLTHPPATYKHYL